MTRGKTASPVSRRLRLERAFAMFKKGRTNGEVARSLKVHPDTVASYRRKYEEHISKVKEDNPGMLLDVLGNTLRSLEELDLVRADAWTRLDYKVPHKCEECEQDCGHYDSLNAQNAATLHNVLLKAMDQRVKLFGLLGVKQEYFMHVQRVQMFQAKLLEFLQTQLCEHDRARLNHYMATELPEFAESTVTPTYDYDAVGEEVS